MFGTVWVKLFIFDLFFESGLFQDIGGCAEHCDDNNEDFYSCKSSKQVIWNHAWMADMLMQNGIFMLG